MSVVIRDTLIGLAYGSAGGSLVLFHSDLSGVDSTLYLSAAGQFNDTNNVATISQYINSLCHRLIADCDRYDIMIDLDAWKWRCCQASTVARECVRQRALSMYEALRLSGKLSSATTLAVRQANVAGTPVSVPMPMFKMSEPTGDDLVLASRLLTDTLTSGQAVVIGESGRAGADAIIETANSEYISDRPPLLLQAAAMALYPWAVNRYVSGVKSNDNGQSQMRSQKLRPWFPNLTTPPAEFVELPTSLAI